MLFVMIIASAEFVDFTALLYVDWPSQSNTQTAVVDELFECVWQFYQFGSCKH